MKDLPMRVAEKNVFRGMPKCPQANPARSKNGLGIEANIRMVMKPWFFKLLMIMFFTYYDVYATPSCLES